MRNTKNDIKKHQSAIVTANSQKIVTTKKTYRNTIYFWCEFLNKVGARQLNGEGVRAEYQNLKGPILYRCESTLKLAPGRWFTKSPNCFVIVF